MAHRVPLGIADAGSFKETVAYRSVFPTFLEDESSEYYNSLMNFIHTLRSPQMLTPDRMPVQAGKNTANILKKFPWDPLQFGKRFSTNISPTEIDTWHVMKKIKCIAIWTSQSEKKLTY